MLGISPGEQGWDKCDLEGKVLRRSDEQEGMQVSLQGPVEGYGGWTERQRG